MRGWSILPSKPAAQLALFSLLFFGTMMFWHWEAMLISYLATRVKVMPFNDIADLVSNTDFRIIVLPSSSMEDAFKNSIDPDWQTAWIQRWDNISKETNQITCCHIIQFLGTQAEWVPLVIEMTRRGRDYSCLN